ncbi:MAG TPA: ATP-binding protein [Acidimicrobiales bacterium]|nr:ATP-binding protein [Acidimicrobiales bacterium]
MFRTQLPPVPANARAARQFVTAALTDLRCSHLEATAALLTSELVTNAIVHAHTPIEVRVVLSRPGRIRIEVDDDDSAEPVAPPTPIWPSGDDESGRGLAMVAALAAAWGVDLHTPPAPGKTVWFELS